MAARLMTNYPGKLSCDPETFDIAKMKLPRSDFSVLPFKVLKGIKDPGIIREYYPSSRYAYNLFSVKIRGQTINLH